MSHGDNKESNDKGSDESVANGLLWQQRLQREYQRPRNYSDDRFDSREGYDRYAHWRTSYFAEIDKKEDSDSDVIEFLNQKLHTAYGHVRREYILAGIPETRSRTEWPDQVWGAIRSSLADCLMGHIEQGPGPLPFTVYFVCDLTVGDPAVRVKTGRQRADDDVSDCIVHVTMSPARWESFKEGARSFITELALVLEREMDSKTWIVKTCPEAYRLALVPSKTQDRFVVSYTKRAH